MDDPRPRYDAAAHYRIEKELAARLRAAPADERGRLYGEVYDELYRRVPDHPQLTRKVSPETTRARVDEQLRMMDGLLPDGGDFLEAGPGDCSLAFAVAAHAGTVVVVDVSEEITRRDDVPANCRVALSDGSSVPVPPASVDLAFSNQLMEHLHPEDARTQLENLFAALRPGGRYLCITPNRLNGPHDVSRGFDDAATGFHLREYTVRDLTRLFREVGFRRLRCRVRWGRGYCEVPPGLPVLIETLLAPLPVRWRRAVADLAPVRAFLNIRLVGLK